MNMCSEYTYSVNRGYKYLNKIKIDMDDMSLLELVTDIVATLSVYTVLL